jgi:hypothetical protein
VKNHHHPDHGGARILSAPNLLTIPGDPLVGYLLAAPDADVLAPGLLCAILASLSLHTAGLVAHEVLPPDADASPRRIAAAAAAAFLFLIGIALCALLGLQTRLIGIAVLISMLLYNIASRTQPFLGALALGLCRGFSLLLGAAAAPAGEWSAPAPVLAFVVTWAYTTAITHLAHRELLSGRIGMERWTPAFVLAAAFAFLVRIHPPISPIECLVFSGALLLAGFVTLAVADTLDVAAPRRLHTHPATAWAVRGSVSLLLGNFLFLQAGMAVASGAGLPARLAAMALLALWPLHRAWSRARDHHP